jgi:hypothetical protein
MQTKTQIKPNRNHVEPAPEAAPVPSGVQLPNRQLQPALAALTRLTEYEMAPALSFKLRRLLRLLRQRAEDFDAELKRLDEHHMRRDGAGKPIPHPSGQGFLVADPANYTAALNALLDDALACAESISQAEIEEVARLNGGAVRGSIVTSLGNLLGE